MVIYSDELGTSVSVTTADVEITGSPYSPLASGRLIQVKLIAVADAATGLIEGVTATLSSPQWGVPVTVSVAGGGIRTAPAFPIPIGVQNCDVPIETGVNLKIVLRNVTGDTPVTPTYQVIGVFES
ncbi:unnamed protein product [marine sediment metagenome]|uniref:Uncharacterized protein n=1 Tax=marine sediment metagenome TaxID=412755 RepID=X1BTL8_9ZZZZ